MNIGLLKAAIYKPPQASFNDLVLPSQVCEQQHRINPRHCERYHELVAWRSGIASVIHPSYLQVLTLPMQLAMMVSKPFPFKPMGLVHLANEIKVTDLPDQNAELSLKTSFAGLQVHKRGYVFALKSEGFVDHELAVEATSFYLARVKHDLHSTEQTNSDLPSSSEKPLLPTLSVAESEYKTLSFPLSFQKEIGRRYASVSGDYNPIHLSPWSAKLLGFKRAIAHGMYSKALCLSMLAKNDVLGSRTASSSIFSDKVIKTQFLQPIYLPSFAQLDLEQMISEQRDEKVGESDSLRFSLNSQQRSRTRLHLLGEIAQL